MKLGSSNISSVGRPSLTILMWVRQSRGSVDRPNRGGMQGGAAMPETTDPTFYRSPADAIAAPPERLAYVAAYDPAGRSRDAMTVIDTDPSSADYGKVVGWSELPTAG